MSDTPNWLERYAEGRSELNRPAMYWASVPLVVLGTVGLLWLSPVPDEFTNISPLLNWGSAFLMVSAVYYFIISLSLAIGMLPFMLGIASLQEWLLQSGMPAFYVSLSLLIAGSLGLWLAHRQAGGIKAVLRDLHMMMLGPLWLLSVVYRRLGIPL